jgi:hypothetical protein
MSDRLRFVNGWVRLQDERPPGRSVRLRVTDARAGSTLAEAISLPDGQFAVAVSLGLFQHSALVVEAVDSAGDVLGRQEVSGDGPTILTLSRALPEEDAAQPGLLTGAVADLAGRVARLEASGGLPTGALAVLDATLGRLAWLDGLLEPARRAILGDTAAAAVVREALGAWAREAPCPAPVLTDSTSSDEHEDEEEKRDDALAVPDILVSTDAVGTFVSAILTAGRTLDEQVEMADGFGAVLSARPWLEALAGVAASGSVLTMQVMMGAPGPMPLGFLGLAGLPPGGLPRGGFPGVPGFPGLPGGSPGGKPKGLLFGRVHPTVADLITRFRSAAMLPPSDKQRCLIFATTEAARIRDSAPVYRITGLAPADACPGAELTITGRNFSTHGSVVFPGTAAPIPNPSAIEWTDGRIRVVVPEGAAPGPITLSILEASFVRCGQLFTVFRTGSSDVPFAGGTAAVTAFLLDGSKDPLRVEPGAVVSISCDVTVHPTVRTRVFVTQADVTIADFGTLAGGGHRQHEFKAPNPAGPVTCIVHLLVSGCGDVDHRRTLTVAATPHLSVAHIEVTQGVQNGAHTMRFVAGRTTDVRAYLTSGLGGFSYNGTPGQVGNVTGRLRVERGGVVVASIPAATPVTIGTTFFDGDRSNSGKALRFEVPGSLMNGDVTMRVSASVAGLPGFGSDTPGTSGSRNVHVERGGTITVMRLRMGLTNPAHPLAAPTVPAWQTSAVGTQDRYPLGDLGMLVYKPTSGDVLSTDHFLGKEKGWHDALDDLDDYADRFIDDFNTIFACTVPADPATPPAKLFALNGTAHVQSLAGGRSRCFLSQTGLQATFAHEMAHTLGVGHARCGDKGMPGGIDPNLPGVTEPGVVGWRRSDGKLIPSTWAELMSYCTPGPPFGDGTVAGYDDRWPSGALWHILLDQLN